MIAILSLALMPLGIIALVASLQASVNADAARRSELRVAATESSRKLSAELAADVLVLRAAAQAIDADAAVANPCERAAAVLRARTPQPVSFALFGPSGTAVCTIGKIAAVRPALSLDRPDPSWHREGETLRLVVPSTSGSSVAVARYTPALLAQLAQPTGYGTPVRLTIDIDGTPLVLRDSIDSSALDRTEAETLPLGNSGLSLTMTIAAASFGPTEALLAFLPLLMWASAAVVGFSVVESLLIRPLRALRTEALRYVPGSSQPLALSATPSIEIRALGASFMAFADRLSDRETELKQSLADQVKLTREVHHRVKNNLQVIASLISLHARGTSAPDAVAAYTGIQRRVDALAVVHRNHFAELENSHGIELKQLLGELAANFRASIAADGNAPAISVSAEPILVAQDTAMPLAFLFTELAEMAVIIDPGTTIVVTARSNDPPTSARLTITSPALREVDAANVQTATRIVEGLARQLRAPLRREAGSDSYAIDFAALSRENNS